jgi:DNA-binding NarL/FixJ family response regulator
LKNVTILLADDHTLFRQGLRALLEGRKDYTVVGEAKNGKDLVKQCRKLNPDIAIVDIGMPGMSGLDATAIIKQGQQKVKVIIVSVRSENKMIVSALEAGASAYLLKNSSADEIFSAIKAAMNNKVFLSPEISEQVVSELLGKQAGSLAPDSSLTPRERTVLQLIAEGLRTDEIAKELKLSKRTIEACRHEIMSKLNLKSIADLVKYAIRHGITSLDS